jgi:hypothetical protein
MHSLFLKRFLASEAKPVGVKRRHVYEYLHTDACEEVHLEVWEKLV